MIRIKHKYTVTRNGLVYQLKPGETYRAADVFEQGKYVPGWLGDHLIKMGAAEPVEPKGGK